MGLRFFFHPQAQVILLKFNRFNPPQFFFFFQKFVLSKLHFMAKKHAIVFYIEILNMEIGMENLNNLNKYNLNDNM